MSTRLVASLLVLAVTAAGCLGSTHDPHAARSDAETAVWVAFGVKVRCDATASTLPGRSVVGAYRCHGARAHGGTVHAGCLVSTSSGPSVQYLSCFGPHSEARCIAHRGDRFVVAPGPSVAPARPAQCPHHVMPEPVVIAGAALRVTTWELAADPPCENSLGLGDPCYPHLYVGADLVFCAHGRDWSVGATDFTLLTTSGESYTGSVVGDWRTLIRRRVRAGRCTATEVAFGPVDDAVEELGDAAFGSANPPTIAFHQHGTPTIDWVGVARPEFRATSFWSP
jgi:hypothetical protein